MRPSKWKKGDRVCFEIDADGWGNGRVVKVKEVHDGGVDYWLHTVRVTSGTRTGTDNGGWSPSTARVKRPKDNRPYKKGALVHALDIELEKIR